MRRLSAVLIAASLLVLLGCQAGPAGDGAELDQYRARILELEQERDALESRIGDMTDRIERLEAMLEDEDLAPTPWSRAGLEFSFQMRDYLKRVDVEGWSPGCTRWQEDTDTLHMLADEPGVTGEDPGSLVSSIASYVAGHALGLDLWEVTVRVLPIDETSGTGIVMLWGLMDDSVGGIDYLLHLKEEQGVWRITGVDVRYHCLRGTDGDVCI